MFLSLSVYILNELHPHFRTLVFFYWTEIPKRSESTSGSESKTEEFGYTLEKYIESIRNAEISYSLLCFAIFSLRI